MIAINSVRHVLKSHPHFEVSLIVVLSSFQDIHMKSCDLEDVKTLEVFCSKATTGVAVKRRRFDVEPDQCA